MANVAGGQAGERVFLLGRIDCIPTPIPGAELEGDGSAGCALGVPFNAVESGEIAKKVGYVISRLLWGELHSASQVRRLG